MIVPERITIRLFGNNFYVVGAEKYTVEQTIEQKLDDIHSNFLNVQAVLKGLYAQAHTPELSSLLKQHLDGTDESLAFIIAFKEDLHKPGISLQSRVDKIELGILSMAGILNLCVQMNWGPKVVLEEQLNKLGDSLSSLVAIEKSLGLYSKYAMSEEG